MKKTIKTAVAIFLVLIMVCCSMTAFASTPADIEWNFWESESNTVYSYAGEIDVDAGAVDVKGSDAEEYVYYTFEAKETGYYSVDTNGECWFGIPDRNENGVYYDTKEYTDSYGFDERVYYLEEGEYIIGFDIYNDISEVVSIEFHGDIVNIAYNEEMLKNLIVENNIYKSDDEEEDHDYWLDTDSITIEFENGSDIIREYTTILVYTDEEFTKGEYEVEIGIYGIPYRQKATVSIVDIRDVVEKVELEDLELFTDLAYYFDGSSYNSSTGTEDLVITYTDGTTEVIEDFDGWNWLESSNIGVESYYDTDEYGNRCYIISVAGVAYVSEVCTEREATALENVLVYHALNISRISRTFEWMGIYFRDIFHADSIIGAMNSLGYFFTESTSDWLYTFASISKNTAWLFDYMF